MVYDPPEDDVLGVCTECHSDQPMSYMEKNAFTREGLSAPCVFCGAPTMIVERKDRDSALAQRNRERGLR